MGRPRSYATSREHKAAWRRRQGMAVRPHSSSAAAKQVAYRVRKRQAARECAAIQQALQTRALADRSWELSELIDACSRVPADRPAALLAGASARFYGMAAVRVRRHRRALQRLAQVRATRSAQAGAPRDTDRAAARLPATQTGGACCTPPRAARVTTQGSRCRGPDGLPSMSHDPYKVTQPEKRHTQGALKHAFAGAWARLVP
jgi:hypothetical protein